MDIDAAFIGTLIQHGRSAIVRAKELQIVPADLNGDHKDALEFLYNYVSGDTGSPTAEVVTYKTGAIPDMTPGSADFWTQEILSKKLFVALQKGLSDMATLMSAGKPRESLAFMENLLREVRGSIQLGTPVVNIFSLADDVLADYEKAKQGECGILTRWPSINEPTLGWVAEDLILFVARVATGKTWSSVLLAHDAWDLTIPSGPRRGEKQRNKVLYVTTELARKRIAARFFAIHLRLPYKQLREGKLGRMMRLGDESYEDYMKKGIQELRGAEGFYIVGGDFDYTIEGLEAAIEKVEPDFIVLDGAYLLKGTGANRTERAANTFDDLKRLAKRYKRPVAVTSQLNRQANPNQKGTVSTESIALTDTAGWNSDVVIGMIQTDDMKKDKRMIFKPLKLREGEAPEIELNWNLDTMNFTEIPRSADGSNPLVDGDAAEDDADSDAPF